MATKKAQNAQKVLSFLCLVVAIPFLLVGRALAFNGLRVHLDLRDIRPSALTVSASRHQIYKSDFIDSAQIWSHDPIAGRDEPRRIELAPAHFGNSEIAREPIDRRAFRPITN